MPSSTVLIPVLIDGTELQVEAIRPAGSEKVSTLSQARDAVADAFDRAQEAIVAVATSTVATITTLGDRSVRPDEVQVKFGLKFTATGSVIVAGASGEATLEVNLTYKRPPAAPRTSGASPQH